MSAQSTEGRCRTQPRVLLVNLRDRTDPMSGHEHNAFARRSGVSPTHIDVHRIMDGRPDSATLRKYDAVLFGGSGAYSVLDDAPWIQQALALLEEVVALQLPAWASCFGFQGLALALGGQVIHDTDRFEMGAARMHLTDEGREDALMAHLPKTFWAHVGHHDHVMELPRGVTRLAWGDHCFEQAFRVDGAPFWASQFHPELDCQDIVDRFLAYSNVYGSNEHQANDEFVEQLRARDASPEVHDVLYRLVHHEF